MDLHHVRLGHGLPLMLLHPLGASNVVWSPVLDMDRVDVPVTLAWAELDRVVNEPRVPVPGARWVVLRGCGRVPTWDDPDLVAGVILEGSSSATGAS
jgi:hypothetical protein